MRIKALIFYGIFFIALAIAVSFLWFNRPGESDEDKVVEDDEVIAQVNDEKIMGATLNRLFRINKEKIPSDTEKLDQILAAYLDSEIIDHLKLERAGELGITASPEEIMVVLQEIYSKNGEEEFEEYLEEIDLSLEQYKEKIRRDLVISKFDDWLLQKMLDEVKVSDDEVEAYYSENKERFNVSRVHILIFEVPQPREDEQENLAREAAMEAISLLERDRTISQVEKDLADSQIKPKLVVFPLRDLARNAADVVNELEPGSFYDRPIWINKNYWVLYRGSEEYIPLADVRTLIIEEELLPEKVLKRHGEYIENLREQADVEVFLE